MMPEHIKMMRRASARYLRAEVRAELLRQERDAAIREVCRSGYDPRSDLPGAEGGITRARIGQIALNRPKGKDDSNADSDSAGESSRKRWTTH